MFVAFVNTVEFVVREIASLPEPALLLMLGVGGLAVSRGLQARPSDRPVMRTRSVEDTRNDHIAKPLETASV
jgi:hypothetical protein